MTIFKLELQDTNPVSAFARLQHTHYSLFLDSADRNHPDTRYSYIACFPVEVIEFSGGRTTITNRNQQTSLSADPFALIQERMQSWPFSRDHDTALPPFQGGLAGFFGYDLARVLEKLPASASEDRDIPDLAVGIYDQVLAFDHQDNKAWLITHAEDKAQAQEKRRPILQLLDMPVPVRKSTSAPLQWDANFTIDEYTSQINKVIDYIKAGDVFQVNLSQRFDAKLPGLFDSFGHYITMRETNPAPFSAYFNLGGAIISCASPERFLKVDETGGVQTRPIKGTRPRFADRKKDEAAKAELQNNEKERAENIMIVDLLRNDLSKCCAPQSIEVTELCHVETFASVHHLVSTVQGQLKSDQTPLDLIKACFPGGSITGAPKIRAMEIIEELEPSRRGPYCGALGYIGFNGTMDTNIIIRTLVYTRNQVSLQVGGGLTADSDPVAEYQETLDKAEAIFQSFDAYEIDQQQTG